MVFSELPEAQLGQAIIVACQREVSSPADLIAEAEWLWSAEDNKVPSRPTLSPTKSISAETEWGCVALLRNPQSNVPQELLDGWTKRVLKEQHYNANDRRRVDGRGMLLIDWPQLTEGGLAPDLLLATSNDPDPTYPTVQEIADAWNRDPDSAEYFHENRKNGIYTFQDEAIKEGLH